MSGPGLEHATNPHIPVPHPGCWMSRIDSAIPDSGMVKVILVIGAVWLANMILGDVLVSPFQYRKGRKNEFGDVVCISHVEEEADEIPICRIDHHSLHEKGYFAPLLGWMYTAPI
ncbi:hypothetical protein AFLA70_305g001471 [Aspergillus flavus AF70]|nr:hypothetical protein AFLA70_305g001471 [Aspergillus flavus AF70]